MPRQRKTNVRKTNKRILILCEGLKTEPNYFNGLIDDCNFPGELVEVKVINVKINTLKELVAEAKRLKEYKSDEIWIVADKDGYTKHPEAFNKAKDNNLKIAFSSISFEFWILIHFVYTTRCFEKADDIITELKRSHFNYKKNQCDIYEVLKDKKELAIDRAGKIRVYQKEANIGLPIYKINPYTNVDELVVSIEKYSEKFKKQYR